MKSMVSKEARQSSFELAKSKSPDLLVLTVSINLKPLPSSIFFLTLNSGWGGDFLASPLFAIKSAQEVSKKLKILKKSKFFMSFKENMVFLLKLYNYLDIIHKFIKI